MSKRYENTCTLDYAGAVYAADERRRIRRAIEPALILARAKADADEPWDGAYNAMMALIRVVNHATRATRAPKKGKR